MCGLALIHSSKPPLTSSGCWGVGTPVLRHKDTKKAVCVFHQAACDFWRRGSAFLGDVYRWEVCFQRTSKRNVRSSSLHAKCAYEREAQAGKQASRGKQRNAMHLLSRAKPSTTLPTCFCTCLPIMHRPGQQCVMANRSIRHTSARQPSRLHVEVPAMTSHNRSRKLTQSIWAASTAGKTTFARLERCCKCCTVDNQTVTSHCNKQTLPGTCSMKKTGQRQSRQPCFWIHWIHPKP